MKFVKNYILALAVFGLFVSSAAYSSVDPKNAESAIFHLEALETKQEKVLYLLDEGEVFMKNLKYQDALKVSQHILKELDSESKEAKTLFEEAQQKIEEETVSEINPVKIKY